MRVYLDLVVLLNFLVDFFLLLGTNRLSGFPLGWKRCFWAAAVGGVYAGACMLPRFRFLGNILWRTVSLAGIGVIAFGCNRSMVKRCAVFLLLSMSMGGISVCLGRANMPALLLAAGGMWLLCRLSFGSGVGQQEYVPIQLTYGEKTMNIIALRDSGNTLRDPITGEQVMVVSRDVAYKLLGLTRDQLRTPLETLAMGAVPGLRLIPYCAVGQGSGILLGLRMDRVKIGDREQSSIVAFAPEGLGEGTVYQALTGGAI